DMKKDVARRRPARRLEAQPDPAVLLVVALEAPRGDGVGESEEPDLGSPEAAQLLLHRLVLAIEHRQKTLSRDVACALPVALVAEGLVVCADRLGDRARGSAHAEEPVGDLLPGPDFGEGPVVARVEIELERLAMRAGDGLGACAR